MASAMISDSRERRRADLVNEGELHQQTTLRLGRCCCRKVARRRAALSQLYTPSSQDTAVPDAEYPYLLLRRRRLPLLLETIAGRHHTQAAARFSLQ